MSFVNPFWNQCNVGPVTAPYQKTDKPRSPDDIQWLYGKIAYASATAGNSVLDTASWKQKFADGQGAYAIQEKGDPNDPFSDKLYIPKAHITAVKISGDPSSYGAVRKASVSFKTYNKAQIESLKGFFTPGEELTITIGWANAGSNGGSETFRGKIYKFNIQLNTDGGYECSCEGIGEGNSTIVNIKADSLFPFSSTITDAAAKTIIQNNLFSYIAAMQKIGGTGTVGVKNFKIPGLPFQLLGATIKTPEDLGSGDTSQASNLKSYIRIDSLIKLCNELIKTYYFEGNRPQAQRASGPSNNTPLTITTVPPSIQFPTDDVLYSAAVADDVRPANPLIVLYAGLTNYEGKEFGPLNLDTAKPAAAGTVKIDFSKVYISCDFIDTLSKVNYIDTPPGTSVVRYLKLGAFLEKIFSEVSRNFGGCFALSLAHSAAANDNTIYIVDQNSYDGAIKPVYLDSIGGKSGTRSINLSSNLPSEVSNAFFVTTQAPNEIKAGDGHLLNLFGNGTSAAKIQDDSAAYKKAVKAVGEQPGVQANVSALTSLLYNKVQYSRESGNASILVPFELTAILDGVPGFEYGNVVSSNYIPDIYKLGNNGVKIGFFVTNIEHNVQAGDWTTTVSTQCKLYK